MQIDHRLLARRPKLVKVIKKKENLPNSNFAISVDHTIKLEESEKRDEYPDLTRELKKLWNMKVTVIPIVFAALGKIP